MSTFPTEYQLKLMDAQQMINDEVLKNYKYDPPSYRISLIKEDLDYLVEALVRKDMKSQMLFCKRIGALITKYMVEEL